jgi:hypothetical protein
MTFPGPRKCTACETERLTEARKKISVKKPMTRNDFLADIKDHKL